MNREARDWAEEDLFYLPSEPSDDKDPIVQSNGLNLNNRWDTFELLSITPVL